MKLKKHLLFPVLCYKDHLHTKQINLFKKKIMHCREKKSFVTQNQRNWTKIYYLIKKRKWLMPSSKT